MDEAESEQRPVELEKDQACSEHDNESNPKNHCCYTWRKSTKWSAQLWLCSERWMRQKVARSRQSQGRIRTSLSTTTRATPRMQQGRKWCSAQCTSLVPYYRGLDWVLWCAKADFWPHHGHKESATTSKPMRSRLSPAFRCKGYSETLRLPAE